MVYMRRYLLFLLLTACHPMAGDACSNAPNATDTTCAGKEALRCDGEEWVEADNCSCDGFGNMMCMEAMAFPQSL